MRGAGSARWYGCPQRSCGRRRHGSTCYEFVSNRWAWSGPCRGITQGRNTTPAKKRMTRSWPILEQKPARHANVKALDYIDIYRKRRIDRTCNLASKRQYACTGTDTQTNGRKYTNYHWQASPYIREYSGNCQDKSNRSETKGGIITTR